MVRVTGTKVVIPPSAMAASRKIPQTLQPVDQAEDPALATLCRHSMGFLVDSMALLTHNIT